MKGVLFLVLYMGFTWSHEQFVVYTPPKCGTHFIANILENLTYRQAETHLDDLGTVENILKIVREANRNNRFVVGHHFFENALQKLNDKNIRIIFILRDPRDQLISTLNWMREGQWNWMPVAKMEDINEQIIELITGDKYGWNCYQRCIGSRLSRIIHLDPDLILVVRYENLVGELGGGRKENQIAEILDLADFLNISISAEQAHKIGIDAYGHSWTFRNGQIGSWKEYFTKRHKTLYKKEHGRILIKLGYEQDLNW